MAHGATPLAVLSSFGADLILMAIRSVAMDNGPTQQPRERSPMSPDSTTRARTRQDVPAPIRN